MIILGFLPAIFLRGMHKNRQILKISDTKVKRFVIIFYLVKLGPVTGFKNSAKLTKPSIF
jgi:hypothetical protein